MAGKPWLQIGLSDIGPCEGWDRDFRVQPSTWIGSATCCQNGPHDSTRRAAFKTHISVIATRGDKGNEEKGSRCTDADDADVKCFFSSSSFQLQIGSTQQSRFLKLSGHTPSTKWKSVDSPIGAQEIQISLFGTFLDIFIYFEKPTELKSSQSYHMNLNKKYHFQLND